MPNIELDGRGIGPSLTVSDLERSIRFYTEGLGFTVTQQVEHEGKVRFVRIKAGEGELGMGQDDFAKGRDRKKGQGVRFWIATTQDLQPLADQAKAAGITLDSDVAPLPWGPLGFSFTDPDGFMWTICSVS